MSRSARPRVLVVGAGFGGLAAVRALRRAPVEVTLLDRHNHHLFTPLLYQVASALLDPSEIAQPVRAVIRRQANADFRLAELTAVDMEQRRVQTTAGPIDYDYLVLATGSVNNFFGNPTIEQHAYPLKDLGEALALRNHVLKTFERAAASNDPEERRRLQTIAVVGAGPTGVECAGAFSELANLALRRDFRAGQLGRVDIELLEAAPHLLGTFAPSLQRAAARTLRRKGIAVHLGTGVSGVADHRVDLNDGRSLPAATIVWTAGVKASPVGELLGVDLAHGGRVPVDDHLRLRGHPEVFVIGDLAAVQSRGGPLPMLAPVAMQEGEYVAEAIAAQVASRPHDAPFRYHDRGTMATIGRNSAIAQIHALRLHGFLGWVTWLFVHLIQIIGFRNRLVVLINWAWDYLFEDRPIRIIAAASPRPEE